MNFNKEYIIVGVLVVVMLLIGSVIFVSQYHQNRGIRTEILNPINNFKNNEQIPENSLESEPNKLSSAEQSRTVIIHIAGEVNKPGVYKLNEKSRVIDALKAAGGETKNAFLHQINLAAPISDGQKIFIPAISSEKNEDDYNYIFTKLQASGGEVEGKININQATMAELEKLTGIGSSRAGSIIEYREQTGRFTSVEQLLEISGIGENILANIRNEITVH